MEDAGTPDVPANVGFAAGDGFITVRWDLPTVRPGRYHVQWKTEDESWEQSSHATLDGAADRYMIAGLVNDTAYSIRVIAESLLGTQTISNEVRGKPYLIAEVRNLAYATETVTHAVSPPMPDLAGRPRGTLRGRCPVVAGPGKAHMGPTRRHLEHQRIPHRAQEREPVGKAPSPVHRPRCQHGVRLRGPRHRHHGNRFRGRRRVRLRKVLHGNSSEDSYGPYTYRITSIGPVGELGNTAEVTLERRPQGPGRPADMSAAVRAAGHGAHDVTLSWDPPDDGSAVTGYRVYRYSRRQFTEVGWQRFGDAIAELGPTDTGYTDAAVPGIISERINYTYAVRAVNDGHSGLRSSLVRLSRGFYSVDIAIGS